MSVENHRVRKYQYEFHTRYGDDGPSDSAIVYLHGERDVLLAVIAFLPDDKPIEMPSESANGHVSAEMHVSRLPGVIDMLRNERPVIVSWSAESAVFRLTTQEEPVGEQELKRLFRFLYI
ncbi:MAG: hypothetical protein AAFX58_03310 [Pseudomonadota bacterium]